MITVNSISGGQTSAYIAVNFPADYEVFSLVCIDRANCRPKDSAVTQYVNEKLSAFAVKYGEFVATAEDDATLVAMMDLEQFIGRSITWVRGASFDNVIDLPLHDNSNPGILPSKLRRYCTTEMKMLPIFDWWFNKVGERVNMRIGFRFDEFERMERFLNGPDSGNFSIPISCSTKGKRLQKHHSFNWRYCSFPLVKHGVTKPHIQDFWHFKGVIPGNLFSPPRRIKWPTVSNCVGCFHKKAETLAVMAAMHPEKLKWFSDQEKKGMGTWLDSKVPYSEIIENSNNWTEEMLKETGAACDSGGCTD